MEPLRKRLTVDGRRVMSVFTDLRQNFKSQKAHDREAQNIKIASEMASVYVCCESPEEGVVLNTRFPHSLAGHFGTTVHQDGF